MAYCRRWVHQRAVAQIARGSATSPRTMRRQYTACTGGSLAPDDLAAEVAKIRELQRIRRARRTGVDPLALPVKLRRARRIARAGEMRRRRRYLGLPVAAIWRADRRRAVECACAVGEAEARKAAIAATLEAVTRLACRHGWRLRHASIDRSGRRSSRYLVNPTSGAEIRLSDHEIPTADNCPWSIVAQERSCQAPRWSEIIVNSDTLGWTTERWMNEFNIEGTRYDYDNAQ